MSSFEIKYILKAIEDRWKKEAEKGAGLNLSKIQFDFPREIFDTVRNSDNVNQLMRRQQGEKRKKKMKINQKFEKKSCGSMLIKFRYFHTKFV